MSKKRQKSTVKAPQPASIPAAAVTAPISAAAPSPKATALREDPKTVGLLLLPLLLLGILISFGGHSPLLAFLACLVSVFLLLRFRSAVWERAGLTTLCLLGYVLLGLASVAWASSGKFVLNGLSALVLALAFYLYILLRSGNTEHALRCVITAVAGCSALLGLISVDGSSVSLLTGLVVRLLPAFGDIATGFEAGTRITGIFGNANILAGVLALGTLLSLYLVLSAQGKRESRIGAACLSINALSFLLAFSMGAIGVFLVAAIVYFVTAREGRFAALVVMVEIAATTILSTFVALLGLGQSGGLAWLPILALALNCAAFFLLHQFVGHRLTELLQSRRQLAIGFIAAIVVLAVGYVALGVSLTGAYTLQPGETLRRSAYPAAGEQTLVSLSDAPVQVTVESQNSRQVMMHTSTVLYTGDAGSAVFTVPEDSRVVYLNYSAADGARLESSALSGSAVKLKYTLLPGFAANRIQGLRANQNAIQRTVFWQDALKLFRQSPVIGLGLGGFASSVRSVQDFFYETTSAHNHYVEALAELGILGLLLFLGILLSSAFSLWQGRKGEKHRQLFPALCACLTMIAGHSAVEVVFSSIPFLVIAFCVFALISLCYGAPHLPRKQGKVIWGGALAMTAALVLLLGCNRIGHLLMTSYHGAGSFFANAELAAKLDVFEGNDYRLSYVLNAPTAGTEKNLETAMDYAATLRQVPSNSIPVRLVSFYLELGEYTTAVEIAREGISYIPTDSRIWNAMLDLLRTGQPTSDGALEPYLEGVAALYGDLQTHNESHMDTIQLSPENEIYLSGAAMLLS